MAEVYVPVTLSTTLLKDMLSHILSKQTQDNRDMLYLFNTYTPSVMSPIGHLALVLSLTKLFTHEVTVWSSSMHSNDD